MTLIEDAVFV